MSGRRIVFLVDTYFQERDVDRFGIRRIEKAGFEVFVWEVFRPWRKHYADNYSPPDPAQVRHLRHFASTEEICSALQGLSASTLVMALIPNALHTARVFRALAKRRLRFGSFYGCGYFPLPRKLQRRRTRKLSEILNSAYIRLPHRLRLASPPWFGLFCGGCALETSIARADCAHKILSHSLDYNIVLQQGKLPKANGAHIVFLDEYVPFHPDDLSHGRRAPHSAEEYFPRMNLLFRQLEKKLSLPVVIAAHPRAKYASATNCFEGRTILQGQTCQLVRDAALVVTHSSISNNFTAIFERPALVVTTDAMAESFYGPFIESVADALGSPLTNVDRDAVPEFTRLLTVDYEKRRRYVAEIIKRPGSPEVDTWETFAQAMLGLTSGDR